MKVGTRIEKRCPKGYHIDHESGLCLDESGMTPQTRERQDTRSRADNPEKDVPDRTRGYGSKDEAGRYDTNEAGSELLAEAVPKDSKAYRDVISANDGGDAGETARAGIVEFMDGNEGRVPRIVAKPFVMVYDEREKTYRRAEKGERGYGFDGHTSTQDVYKVNGEYTPERKALHAQIVKRIVEGYTDENGRNHPGFTKPEGRKPRIVFMGGGSGAGKSSLTERMKEDGLDFPSIDPDAIMVNHIPEYGFLSEQNTLTSAFLAHNEASDISMILFRICIENGYDFIMDGTLSKSRKLAKLQKMVDESGQDFEKVLRGVIIDVDDAKESCKQRYVKTKRFVPMDVAEKSNRGFDEVAHNEELMAWFDGVKIYHRKGDEVTEVMERRDGKTEVKDEAKWKREAKKMKKAGNKVFGISISPSSLSQVEDDTWSVVFRATDFGIDFPIQPSGPVPIDLAIDKSDVRSDVVERLNRKAEVMGFYPEEPTYDFDAKEAEFEAMLREQGKDPDDSEDDWAEFRRDEDRARDELDRAWRAWDEEMSKLEDMVFDFGFENVRLTKVPTFKLKAKYDADYDEWDMDDGMDVAVKGTLDAVVGDRRIPIDFSVRAGVLPSDDFISYAMDACREDEYGDSWGGSENMDKMKKANMEPVQQVGEYTVFRVTDDYDSPFDGREYYIALDGEGEPPHPMDYGSETVEEEVEHVMSMTKANMKKRSTKVTFMVDEFGFTPVDFVHKSKVSKDGEGGTRYGITDAQVSRIYDVVSGGFRYDGSTYDIGDLVSISEGLLAHWKKLEGMPTGQLGMFINEIISSLENAVRYISYARDSELDIDLDDEDGWTYIHRSKDKIDPSNPESIRKGGDLGSILSGGEYMGGETDPDGDMVQYRVDGRTVNIYLNETFDDSIPSDEDIMRTAVAIGWDNAPRHKADPIGKSRAKKGMDWDDVREWIVVGNDSKGETFRETFPDQNVALDFIREKEKGGYSRDGGSWIPSPDWDKATIYLGDFTGDMTLGEIKDKMAGSRDMGKSKKEPAKVAITNPQQLFKACWEYQEANGRNGLEMTEVADIAGGTKVQSIVAGLMSKGMVTKIGCAEGFIYRFNGNRMRRM